MNLFGYSYEYYIPDSQLIFPCIFLNGILRLDRHTKLLKDCFDLMQEHCNFFLLPANVRDFQRLIIQKFPRFLKDIERQIFKIPTRGWSKNEFFEDTRRYLRSWEYGDFIDYWERDKNFFWDCRETIPTIVRTRMLDRTIDINIKFNEKFKSYKVNFTQDEKSDSEILFEALDILQKENILTSKADPADLAILSDCLIYKEKRLEQGIMYLVSGDHELYKATEEVVNNPHLLNPDLKETDIMSGLRPLTPEGFVKGIKDNIEGKTDPA